VNSSLIEFQKGTGSSRDDLPGLRGYVTQLVGEPFQFARVSYGDELTLHFGMLRPARSRKLANLLYGTYILRLRGSPWVLKSAKGPLVISPAVFDVSMPEGARLLSKEELEKGEFIELGSHVFSATPVHVRPVEGFGFHLVMSDGSAIFVFPIVQEPDAPEDEGLPELADWELLSPRGLLRIGPGLQWSFEPAEATKQGPGS
jgi:hypothetical protein